MLGCNFVTPHVRCVVGRKNSTAIFQAGDHQLSPPHGMYFHLFRSFKSITPRPRNGVAEYRKLRWRVHKINNPTCSNSSFCRITVLPTMFHSNFVVRGSEIWRKNGTKQVPGNPGTRSSQCHFPADRAGSGLQTLADTRLWQVHAGFNL